MFSEHSNNSLYNDMALSSWIKLSDSKSFTEDEKQKLISRCEEEILQEYKSGGMKLVLAALGLGYFI